MKKYIAILMLILFMGSCSLLFPPQLYNKYQDAVGNITMYVSVYYGNDTNSGLSPKSPKKSIPATIGSISTSGLVEIRIAAGEYTPGNGLNSDPDHAGITIARDNIHLSGGWSMDFKTNTPDFNNNSYLIGFTGSTNLKHVISAVSTSEPLSNISIEMLIISDGYSANYGGGIFFEKVTSSSIINCTISNNYATNAGGGITIQRCSNIVITSNNISENSTTYLGGGLSIFSSHYTTISDNTFFSNTVSAYDGGAIVVHNENPAVSDPSLISSYTTISNNTFISNSAATNGNALSLKSVSKTLVIYNNFNNNISSTAGQSTILFFNEASYTSFDPIGEGTKFLNNTFSMNGGGAQATYFFTFTPSGGTQVLGHNISGNTFNSGPMYLYNNVTAGISTSSILEFNTFNITYGYNVDDDNTNTIN